MSTPPVQFQKNGGVVNLLCIFNKTRAHGGGRGGGVKINADNNFHLSLLHFNGGGGRGGGASAPEDKQVDRIVCERNILETPSLCTPQIPISIC